MSGAVSFSAAGGRSPLRATISPSYLYGFKIGNGTVITSSPATVLVTGGAPPYTYLWTDVVNLDSITETLPSNRTTYWRKTFTSTSESATGTFKCVVTDALGTSVDTTNSITVDLSTH
jgi:hypothetical protein